MLTFLSMFGPVSVLFGVRVWERRRAQKKLVRRILKSLEEFDDGKGLVPLFTNQVEKGKATVLLTALPLLVAYAFLPLDLGAKIIGMALSIMLTSYTLFEKDTDWDHLQRLGAAAKAMEELKRKGKPEQVDALFEFLLLQRQNPELVSIGVNALSEWKPSQIPIPMEQYEGEDTFELDMQVKMLDTSTWEELLENVDFERLETVGEMLDESKYWARINEELLSTGELSGEWKIDPEQQDLVDFLARNQVLVKQVFSLVCTRCVARAVVRGPHRLVQCRKCKEAIHLIGGVSLLKGEVGGEVSGLQEDGTYLVQLWDEQNQTARPAEIGELEIVAGADLNYDWAVSACLETLVNARSEGQPKPKLTVQEGVELQPNTLFQLEAFRGRRHLNRKQNSP